MSHLFPPSFQLRKKKKRDKAVESRFEVYPKMSQAPTKALKKLLEKESRCLVGFKSFRIRRCKQHVSSISQH